MQTISTRLRTSFWFLPGLLILGAMLLAGGLGALDARLAGTFQLPWPKVNSPGTVQQMLSAIASSMITVAGVTFSIVIVALAAAANQYSPRVLRTFVRDRPSQVVLGVFLGVYIYCLLVLAAIDDSEGASLPQLSILVALILALLAVAFLIYFIHHIAGRIQVSNICEEISRETLEVIEALYPESPDASPTPPLPELAALHWHEVPASSTGYIQMVDEDALLAQAVALDGVVRMEKGVGEFVFCGERLLSVSGAAPTAERSAALVAAFTIDTYRNIDQDVEFGIRQLVDIAMRALSPGVNDTTTAQVCISYLTEILARLSSRDLCRPFRWEGDTLRLVLHGPHFAPLVDVAFSQIRINAEKNPQVLDHLIDALVTIGRITTRHSRVQVLRDQAGRVAAMTDRCSPNPDDCREITRRAKAGLAALDARLAACSAEEPLS